MKYFEEPVIMVQNIVVEDVLTTSCTNYTARCPNESDDDWT